MIFYGRIVAYIREKVFEINSCDPCVDNKMIGGKKMMVFWNVEDLKVSHVDLKKVSKFVECLEGMYGE